MPNQLTEEIIQTNKFALTSTGTNTLFMIISRETSLVLNTVLAKIHMKAVLVTNNEISSTMPEIGPAQQKAMEALKDLLRQTSQFRAVVPDGIGAVTVMQNFTGIQHDPFTVFRGRANQLYQAIIDLTQVDPSKEWVVFHESHDLNDKEEQLAAVRLAVSKQRKYDLERQVKGITMEATQGQQMQPLGLRL